MDIKKTVGQVALSIVTLGVTITVMYYGIKAFKKYKAKQPKPVPKGPVEVINGIVKK